MNFYLDPNLLAPHDWPNDWLQFIDQRLDTVGNMVSAGHHISQGSYPGLEDA